MTTAPNQLASRAAEALAWSSLGAPLRAALAVLVSVVTARLLGPRAYGAYAILLSLLGTLTVYTDLGIGRSLLRFLPYAARRYGLAGVRVLLRDVLAVRFGVSFAAAAAILSAPAPIAFALGLPEGIPWVRMAAAIHLLQTADDIAERILQANLYQKWTSVIAIVASLLQFVLLGAFLGLGFGVSGALAVIGIVSAGSALVLTVAARGACRSLPPGHPPTDPHEVTRLLVPHAVTIYTIAVTRYFTDLSFVVFLLAASGVDAGPIGQFALALRMVNTALDVAAGPAFAVQLPYLAAREIEGPSALARANADLTRGLLLLLVPGSTLLWVAAPDLVRLLYGPAYAPVAGYVRLLVPCFAIATIFQMSANVLLVRGDYREVVRLRLAGVGGAPFVAAAAAFGGVVPASLVVGLARMAIAAYGHRLAAGRYDLFFPTAFARRCVLAGGALTAAAGSAAAIVRPAIPALIAETLAGTIAFLVVFRGLGGVGAEERRILAGTGIPGIARLARWL